MRGISDDQVRRIIDGADIVQTVGSFVELKRKGANYTGICPFHDDRHAGNLMVSPSKNIVKCFACGDKAMDSVAFLEKTGMTFENAVKWLACSQGMWFDKKDWDIEVIPAIKKAKVERTPFYFNIDWVDRYIGNYATNDFVHWLNFGIPWPSSKMKGMIEYWLKAYRVGTSLNGRTMGWVIWWQIDASGRLLTGKLMKYKRDGHRDKESGYSIDHFHSIMERNGRVDLSDKEIQSCLFGLHLVKELGRKKVCIVESEKSAIVAQIYNTDDDRLFVATGGKGKLTKEMLQPLKNMDCYIILYPDVDAIEEWTKFANEYDYGKISVSKNMERLYDPAKDSPKADIADILVRVMEEKRDEVFIRDSHPNAEV